MWWALIDGGVGLGVGTQTRSALVNGCPHSWPIVTDVAANGHGGGLLLPVVDGGVGCCQCRRLVMSWLWLKE